MSGTEVPPRDRETRLIRVFGEAVDFLATIKDYTRNTFGKIFKVGITNSFQLFYSFAWPLINMGDPYFACPNANSHCTRGRLVWPAEIYYTLKRNSTLYRSLLLLSFVFVKPIRSTIDPTYTSTGLSSTVVA